MTVGQRLKAAREAKDLTQRQVAALCGVSQPTVHYWETHNSVPQRRWGKVAEVYGLNIGDLIPKAEAA